MEAETAVCAVWSWRMQTERERWRAAIVPTQTKQLATSCLGQKEKNAGHSSENPTWTNNSIIISVWSYSFALIAVIVSIN